MDPNSPGLYDEVADYPYCAYQNGYYQSVGCSSSGGFTIDNFSDQYCTQYVSTSNNLKSLNNLLKKYSCHECVSDTGGDDDSYSSLCDVLLTESDVCSYNDFSLCSNPNGNDKIKSISSNVARKYKEDTSSSSFGNKVKFFFGTIFLVASCGMFLGILLLNRKKRRALLFRRGQHRSKRSSKSDREKRQVDKGEFA